MRAAVISAIVLAGGALAGGAAAATLLLVAAPSGAGDASVLPCDPNGFTHGYTTSRGLVTAVTVGGLADPACEGGSVRASVTDASGASLASAGPQAIPVDGDTADNAVTLATSPQPGASLVAGIHIVVEGP